MKTNYSSKAEIFEKAKEIVFRDGLDKLSMRRLAGECYLALGTLYHYFNSKEDLIVEIIEDFWKERFKPCYEGVDGTCFKELFSRFYDVAYSAFGEFEDIFTSVKIVGTKSLFVKGKEKEQRFMVHLSHFLIDKALQDPNVNRSTFDDDFPLNSFIQTLLDVVILSLVNHTNIKTFVLALITRTMY